MGIPPAQVGHALLLGESPAESGTSDGSQFVSVHGQDGYQPALRPDGDAAVIDKGKALGEIAVQAYVMEQLMG